jgi:cyanate permease
MRLKQLAVRFGDALYAPSLALTSAMGLVFTIELASASSGWTAGTYTIGAAVGFYATARFFYESYKAAKTEKEKDKELS